MRIFLVGGGSGGHLTPLLAVAHEIKQLQPGAELVYIAHRGDDLHAVVRDHETIARTHTIFAGKLRRYHGAGWRQFLDIPTFLKNVRDAFMLLLGLLQSLVIVRKEKPDVLFIKGGFVGVPVGLAARFWRIPYITHDSDALPGLANRLISKHAQIHAVALPKELYVYSPDKTVEVGVPVSTAYAPLTEEDKHRAQRDLQISAGSAVLLVTGGGLGARRINNAVLSSASELFDKVPNLFILHQAGKKNEEEVRTAYNALSPERRERVRVYGFTDQMAALSAAADVVVSRAGATNMAELALQGKAVVMVPNPFLTGGHQLKNAEAFQARDAAVIVPEEKLDTLGQVITDVLQDKTKQKTLEKNLHSFAKPRAARDTAELILQVAAKR